MLPISFLNISAYQKPRQDHHYRQAWEGEHTREADDDRQPVGATDCAARGIHGFLVGLALCGAAFQLACEGGGHRLLRREAVDASACQCLDDILHPVSGQQQSSTG